MPPISGLSGGRVSVYRWRIPGRLPHGYPIEWQTSLRRSGLSSTRHDPSEKPRPLRIFRRLVGGVSMLRVVWCSRSLSASADDDDKDGRIFAAWGKMTRRVEFLSRRISMPGLAVVSMRERRHLAASMARWWVRSFEPRKTKETQLILFNSSHCCRAAYLVSLSCPCHPCCLRYAICSPCRRLPQSRNAKGTVIHTLRDCHTVQPVTASSVRSIASSFRMRRA